MPQCLSGGLPMRAGSRGLGHTREAEARLRDNGQNGTREEADAQLARAA